MQMSGGFSREQQEFYSVITFRIGGNDLLETRTH
jgi:hypothetical protein